MTRATHSLLLGLLLTTPLVACVFSKQLDPDGIADDSSGATGSTGDDGEMSGTTVGSSGGASISSTSATATAGSAGEDTTGGEAFCDPGPLATLVLEIDDVQSAVQYEADGIQGSAIGTEIELHDGGGVYVRAPATEGAPSPVQAAGYVRLPPDALSDPGSWFCFDETSTYTTDGEDIHTVEMNGLAKLGPCPGGVPVEGSITVCLGDPSCGGTWALDATLGADAFSEVTEGYGYESSADVHAYAIEVGGVVSGTGGQLGFRVAEGPGDGTQLLPLEAPYLVVPLDQPDGGAIYCGGAGSSMTAVDGELVSVEFVDLTRLGSCADGEATGHGMFCSNLGG